MLSRGPTWHWGLTAIGQNKTNAVYRLRTCGYRNQLTDGSANSPRLKRSGCVVEVRSGLKRSNMAEVLCILRAGSNGMYSWQKRLTPARPKHEG